MQSFEPANKKEWRNWLEKNHETEEFVWLILFRKNSPKHNLTWSEAVDEALCFGWIDSTVKRIDSESTRQYFTKRKKNSTWSKINKEKVAIFIEQNLMAEAGLKTIEVAKANGSWTILDEVDALILPPDLSQAFLNHEGALDFYENLSNSTKKMLLYWLVSAKRPETRQKRIEEIAENAGNQMKPKAFR